MRIVIVALFAGIAGCAFVQPAAAEDALKEKVLYSFCSRQNCTDGAGPYAGLFAANGLLFGTTECGGTGNCAEGGGTVFSFDPATAAEKVLYNFCSRQTCTDGYAPEAGVIAVKGPLYGTTYLGGNSPNQGVVFALDRNTGAETVLHSFEAGSDGAYPQGGLVHAGHMLYGTTMGGGDGFGCGGYGCGTVFSIDLNSGAEAVLHVFCSQQNCGDGGTPLAGLIDVNGILYGTTEIGGAQSVGTVFSLDRHTGAETVVYSFGGSTDGQYPWGGLIDVNGTFYGTTYRGGTKGYGTIFAFDPNSGVETVLYSFCSQQGCTDGSNPTTALMRLNGKLYGTTPTGGSGSCYGGCGTVFSFDLNSGTEATVHSFCSEANCADGETPAGGLIDLNGTLYGTTFGGGKHSCQTFGCGGTVFAIARH